MEGFMSVKWFDLKFVFNVVLFFWNVVFWFLREIYFYNDFYFYMIRGGVF